MRFGYYPSTGKWNRTGDLNFARLYQTTSLLPNGKVLAIAGVNGDSYIEALDSAELYDPSTGNWTRTDDLNCRR
jgi:hypothetical protein